MALVYTRHTAPREITHEFRALWNEIGRLDRGTGVEPIPTSFAPEVPDIPPLADCPVDGLAFRFGEGIDIIIKGRTDPWNIH